MKLIHQFAVSILLSLAVALYAQADTKKVNVQTFGAVCNKIADDTAALQKAITYAIANNLALDVDGMCRINPATMVNIDRLVDGVTFDKYLVISSSSGGGFYITGNGAMFSSTIPFTTAPVSQLIRFQGINFESDVGGARYVLNDGRFLRIVFDGCTFDRILLVNSTIYTQSMYLIGVNNIRRIIGDFYTAPTSIDFVYEDNVAEAITGNLLKLGNALGVTIIGDLFEGITGTAITYNGAQGLAIHSDYFEANGKDIDGTGATAASGVSILGNKFAHTNSADYSVIWGAGVIGGASMANQHNGSMHNVPAGADVLIKDTASTSLMNNTVSPNIPSNLSISGTLSTTGTITSTVTNGSLIFGATSATTNAKGISLANTGGGLNVGVESSGGGALLTGSAGYAAIINSTQAKPIQFGIGNGLVAQIGASGGFVVGAPTGGDKGSGTINIINDIYKNNAAYVNPDYVLEHWATGKIEKFADKEDAGTYRGLRPLAEVRAYAKEHFSLPRFGQDAGHGLFSGSEALLAATEEAYLYLFEHDDRIGKLEQLVHDLSAKIDALEAANDSAYRRVAGAR
jgi:hypothetical protein